MNKLDARAELIKKFSKISEDFKYLNPDGPSLMSIFKQLMLEDIKDEIDTIYKDLIGNGFTYEEIINLIKEQEIK